MDCNEMIMSEEVQDFIIEYNPRAIDITSVSGEACFQTVNADWSVGYAKLPDQYQMNISDLGYQTIPKLYGLMDSTSMDEAGISSTLSQPFLNVAGQGTIIGFIDTGIDYNLDIFKNSPLDSRIGVIWDQTIQTSESDRTESERSFRAQLNGEFAYGTMYTRTQINEAISQDETGGDPYSVVPSRDENGHGTFLAGIAAGGRSGDSTVSGDRRPDGSAVIDGENNQRGNVLTDFTGAAPQAEIAVVKLKPAKQYLRDYFLINESAVAYQETDIMLGVSFLLKYAEIRQKALVICVGVATGSGPRTGATPLANVLEYAAEIPNVVIVACIGNEANERTHVFGRVTSLEMPDTIEINVGEGEKGFVLELWASTQDVLSVSMVSPSGETISRIPARVGDSNIFKFLLEGTEVSVDYRVVEQLSGYELIFMRFLRPTPGIWRINVYSLTNIAGAYNAWIPIRQFLTGDTFLLRSSPLTTLLEPSAAMSIITVGAYDHITGATFIDTSRGFTAQGQVKPDLIAPGVNVYGPAVGGGYTYRSGTSVAAAHVAGAAALLLTWGVYYQNLPRMSTSDVKYILIRGANRSESETYPNRISGYGKMNLFASFTEIRVT